MQGTRLYVGNLTYAVTNQQLENLFSNYGEVKEITVIEGKGFAFIQMSSTSEAEAAKEALDGTDFEGRTLRVDEARPQKDKDRQKRRFPRY